MPAEQAILDGSRCFAKRVGSSSVILVFLARMSDSDVSVLVVFFCYNDVDTFFLLFC